MDRKMPKTNFTRRGEDPYAVFDEYAERLKNTPHETVEIESHDGLKLVGHWFENEDPKRIILAAHGWRSHWYRDFAYSFQFLREQGCSILYIEQRAQGASEGKYFFIKDPRSVISRLPFLYQIFHYIMFRQTRIPVQFPGHLTIL